MAAATSLEAMVTALLPSLSRSLAEQFNVFRVMRHGTHEKQLSNVFAWLLNADGTHHLGDAFQRLFIAQVNRHLPAGGELPTAGYVVTQEVDTSGPEDLGKDVADILLTSPTASVVIENYESSDGHGHGYQRYLAHGTKGGRRSAVVLLCMRREHHRQTDGWERAVVVTYAEVLQSLQEHIARETVWRRTHQKQNFFISQLIENYEEGPGAVNDADRIAFIKAMCDTGESARYGARPQAAAAQEFADLLALHAKRQFEEGRKTLAEVKVTLRRYAERNLMGQVNAALHSGPVASVQTPFHGQWEWCVALGRADPFPNIYLEFGPTAVSENARVASPVAEPDYSKIFVTRQAEGDGIDQIAQTDVSIAEVLAGLSENDVRLRDAALELISRQNAHS